MKTRHLILYHNHLRNDGPPLYYFLQLQKKFGKNNVTHLIPEGDIRRYGDFDYTWWIDYGEDSFVTNPGVFPESGNLGKKIYVVSDAHVDKTDYRFNQATKFDYVFFNQKHYSLAYTEHLVFNKLPFMNNQKSFYLPHAAEPLAYPHTKRIPKWDIVFIGHVQMYHVGNGVNITRMDFLDEMFKEFPNFYYGTRNPVWPEKNMFEDAAQKFNSSKITLNISIGNDLNMRFFETLVSGSFLLTNKIPELKNAEDYGFVDGLHYISYSSLEDAKKKAHYYIEHDEEREQIAKAGYKQALKTGTYRSRIEEIVKTIG